MAFAPLVLVALLIAGAWFARRGERPPPTLDMARADEAQTEPHLDQAEVTAEVEAAAFAHGPHPDTGSR